MLGNNKWGTMQGSSKEGTTTWSNKWGITMSGNNNTRRSKPKATKKREKNN
jgi:hypothetical protein